VAWRLALNICARHRNSPGFLSTLYGWFSYGHGSEFCGYVRINTVCASVFDMNVTSYRSKRDFSGTLVCVDPSARMMTEAGDEGNILNLRRSSSVGCFLPIVIDTTARKTYSRKTSLDI
jgi:hypothetical protein